MKKHNKKNNKQYRNSWELYASSLPANSKLLNSRRHFFKQTTGLMAGMSFSAAVLAKNKSSESLSQTSDEPWLTISEVQEHLFPRTATHNTLFSPGAKDINAIGYLQTMLHLPSANKEEADFIIKGVGWLNGVANNQTGKSFITLNDKQREQVLKKISASEAGENWLSTLIRYIFEALLADPVYGGNKKQLGWQWLKHQAGYPRPPENKKYWMLKRKLTIKDAYSG